VLAIIEPLSEPETTMNSKANVRVPSRRASLVIPSALSVALIGCPPAQTAPSSCVMGYVVPPDAGAPAASVRPMVDLSPCSATFDGQFSCTTAAGCTVLYGDGVPTTGTPASSVFCPADRGCLFGISNTGQPQFAPCPTLELPNQGCSNLFDLRDVARSAFSCNAMMTGCALPDGTAGQRLAFVRRTLDGHVESSACPTPCTPFA
jgi:hypothetical protein